jgi:uncharacterized protein DUF6924
MEAGAVLPMTEDALVVRTEFDHEEAWKTICGLIRQPVHDGSDTFHAYVEFLDDPRFRNIAAEELLARVPSGYPHSFLMVVDNTTTQSPEFIVLVIDLQNDRGRTFRAVATTIQGIENNLSIANMEFSEFADHVDEDGVFRKFRDS